MKRRIFISGRANAHMAGTSAPPRPQSSTREVDYPAEIRADMLPVDRDARKLARCRHQGLRNLLQLRRGPASISHVTVGETDLSVYAARDLAPPIKFAHVQFRKAVRRDINAVAQLRVVLHAGRCSTRMSPACHAFEMPVHGLKSCPARVMNVRQDFLISRARKSPHT